MPDLKIGFTSFDRLRGVLVVFCTEGLKFGPATQKILSPISDHLRRAAAVDRFTGKIGSALNIIAPTGLSAPRLIVVGVGKERDLKDRDLVRLGGICGRSTQGRPDCKSCARRAPARVPVRSVQDEAQGRRRTASQGGNKFRQRQPGRRRKGVGGRGWSCRRRRLGARPHQRAG
jgi:hypothetical protein